MTDAKQPFPRESEMLKSSRVLFAIAEEINFHPRWETFYGLFSVFVNGKRKYFFHTLNTLNTQLSGYFAQNKHVTRTILQNEDLPNIPYCLPQSFAELEEFFQKYQKIVSKPTMGTRSQNVELITSVEHLHQIPFQERIFEQYIEGTEYRYLVLRNKVVAVQERALESEPDQPWKKHRRSLPIATWNAPTIKIALQTAQALGLQFCAVDFLRDKQEKYWILEVNSAPAMYTFQDLDDRETKSIARQLFLEMLEK